MGRRRVRGRCGREVTPTSCDEERKVETYFWRQKRAKNNTMADKSVRDEKRVASSTQRYLVSGSLYPAFSDHPDVMCQPKLGRVINLGQWDEISGHSLRS